MDFTIGDMAFQSGKMSLFASMDVLKRISPFVPALTLAYMAMEKGDTKVDAMIAAGPSLLTMFSRMADADVHYVVNACLSITQVQQNGAWSNVTASGKLMFENIDLLMVGQICDKVLEDTFRPFFAGLRALSPSKTIAD